jgi:hypothetical protein
MIPRESFNEALLSWCRYTQEAACSSEIIIPNYQSLYQTKKNFIWNFSCKCLSLGFVKLRYCNWQPLAFLSSSTDMNWTVYQNSSIIPQVYLDAHQHSFITTHVISEWHTFSAKCWAIPVTLFTPTSVFSTEPFQKVFAANPCKNCVSYIWKNVHCLWKSYAPYSSISEIRFIRLFHNEDTVKLVSINFSYWINF